MPQNFHYLGPAKKRRKPEFYDRKADDGRVLLYFLGGLASAFNSLVKLTCRPHAERLWCIVALFRLNATCNMASQNGQLPDLMRRGTSPVQLFEFVQSSHGLQTLVLRRVEVNVRTPEQASAKERMCLAPKTCQPTYASSLQKHPFLAIE